MIHSEQYKEELGQPHYGLEEHLELLSKRSPAAETLYSIWLLDKRCLTAQLSVTSRMFLPYSDHSALHSSAIIAALNLLLGERRIRLLSAIDTWAILECAFRHDTGMQVSRQERDEFVQSEKFIRILNELQKSIDIDLRAAATDLLNVCLHSKDAQDNIMEITQYSDDLSVALSYYYRKHHAERAEKMQNARTEVMEEYGIPRRIWTLVCKICKGHMENRDTIMQTLKQYEDGIDNEYMHPRFVQILLRIGDLLDLDNNRFNLYQLREWGKLTDASMAHFVKHKQITHLLINESRIELKAEFTVQPRCVLQKSQIELYSQVEADYKAWANEIAKRMEKKDEAEILVEIGRSRKNLDEQKLVDYWKQEDEYYRMAKIQHDASGVCASWFNMIKEELDYFSLKWPSIVPENFPGSVPVLSPDDIQIWWQGQRMDFDTIHLQYSISHRRAAAIIQSTGLYGDVDLAPSLYIDVNNRAGAKELVFIRELVQNAMDATKLQVFRYLREKRYGDALRNFGNHPNKWDPLTVIKTMGDSLRFLGVDVLIRFCPGSDERIRGDMPSFKKGRGPRLMIEVHDVGTGIDSKALKDMSKIGDTRSEEIERDIMMMPDWLRPNGAFGIGMQSVFGIVDEFKAVSGSRKDHKLRDIFFTAARNGGDLFAVERSEDQAQTTAYGTRVKVEINAEKMEQLNILSCSLKNPFRQNCETVFDILGNQISHMLGSDIFPIKIRYFIDDVEVHKRSELPSSKYESVFDMLRGESGQLQPIVFRIPPNDNEAQNVQSEYKGKEIQICQYDDETGIVLKMTLQDIASDKVINGFGSLSSILMPIQFFYRGMRVTAVELTRAMLYPCWQIEAYVFRDKPEDVITITRNQLLPQVQSDWYRHIANAADKAMSAFFDSNTFQSIPKAPLSMGQVNALVLSAAYFRMVQGLSSSWAVRQPSPAAMDVLRELARKADVSVSSYQCIGEELRVVRGKVMPQLIDDFGSIWFIYPEGIPFLDETFRWMGGRPEQSGRITVVQDIFANYIAIRGLQSAVSKIALIDVSAQGAKNMILHPVYQYGDYPEKHANLPIDSQKAWLEMIVQKSQQSEIVNPYNMDWRNALIVLPAIDAFEELHLRVLKDGMGTSTLQALGNYSVLPFTLEQLNKLHEDWLSSSGDPRIFDEFLQFLQRDRTFWPSFMKWLRMQMNERYPTVTEEQISERYLNATMRVLEQIREIWRD